MPTCHGCHQNFSAAGLIKHGALSTKPVCRRDARFRLAKPRSHYTAGRKSRTISPEPAMGPDVSNREPTNFEGDFFGTDYEVTDLPGWASVGEASEGLNVGGDVASAVDLQAQSMSEFEDGPLAEEDSEDELELAERMEAMRTTWEPPVPAAGNDTPAAVVNMSTQDYEPRNGSLSAGDIAGHNPMGPRPTQSHVSRPDADLDQSESHRGDIQAEEDMDVDDSDYTSAATTAAYNERTRMDEALRHQAEIVTFPSDVAGKPIPGTCTSPHAGYKDYKSSLESLASQSTNIYAPFASKMEWDLIRWSKTRGPGSSAFDELLAIEGIQDKLGLSFSTTRKANAIVDTLPAPRPKFERDEITVDGQAYDVYFRDVLKCIEALYSEPDFAGRLVFLPERHYHDPDHTQRLYHDMHTGKWWWAAQTTVEARTPGATIIPVILSSDKTQLTLFRNKAAYPVYMTIGNLPKDIRSKPSRAAQVLLAYLPTTKLEHIGNKSARRRAQANLFHACMRRILGTLEDAGLDGIPMTSGDGVTRRVHPLYAAYIGDYPEQVLVTCTKYGECPVCTVPRDKLGDHSNRKWAMRDLQPVLEALAQVDDVSRASYARKCKAAGIKPVYKPFWETLPYADIFLSITPDILHQLLQGVIKHLVAWIKEAYSEAEIDARCRRFPPNHNVRLFFKGITKLSRLTGNEHADICRILLALVIDLPLSDADTPAGSHIRLVAAVRSMLDFVYLAQYPVHSTQTLDALENALVRFHENKTVFVDLGIRLDFDLPKLHFCQHYRELIENLGTADNFNTEYTERLHIDMAKDAYRATNKKDEYDQMTVWLERKEKVSRYERYIRWRESGQQEPAALNPLYRQVIGSHVHMTRGPSLKAVPFHRLASDYGAQDFEASLRHFIVKFNNPTLSAGQVKALVPSVRLRNFDRVPVYHKAKFWEVDFPRYRHASDEYDVIHATPSRLDKRGKIIPGRFDTALVNLGAGKSVGVRGYRVGQVRVIFKIPPRFADQLFLPGRERPDHLVYVEWFTNFTQPHAAHGLYQVKRSEDSSGKRVAEVRALSDIRRGIHLNPKFGPVVPRHWTSSNVLDECPMFWVSQFMDRHAYGTVV